MPHSPQHQRQKGKNYALFAVLIGLIVIVYAVTVTKIEAAKGAAKVDEQTQPQP